MLTILHPPFPETEMPNPFYHGKWEITEHFNGQGNIDSKWHY